MIPRNIKISDSEVESDENFSPTEKVWKYIYVYVTYNF